MTPVNLTAPRFGALYHLQAADNSPQSEAALKRRQQEIANQAQLTVISEFVSGTLCAQVLTDRDANQYWKDTYGIDMLAHQDRLKTLSASKWKKRLFAVPWLRSWVDAQAAATQNQIDGIRQRRKNGLLINGEFLENSLIGTYLAKQREAQGKTRWSDVADLDGKPMTLETVPTQG